MNTQVPEQPVKFEGFYDVQEVFQTLQGEGPRAGQSAVFVRLAGCNLQCPLCDTDYTSQRRYMDVDQLIAEINGNFGTGTAVVVLTGGEPFRQNILPLVNKLFTETPTELLQIETNGTLPIWNADVPANTRIEIICSPKTDYVDPSIASVVRAYKYVVHHKHIGYDDRLPRLALANRLGRKRLWLPPDSFPAEAIYVQPADVGDEKINAKNLDCCIELAHSFGYTLSLQSHKVIGLP